MKPVRILLPVAVLFLLLALPLLRADGFGTSSGWGERVEARVLDSYDRPIPGALVNVSWYITSARPGVTKTVPTNEFGRAYFQIDSYEYIVDKVNYTFLVSASYDGLTQSKVYDHRVGTGPRTVWLPVYRVDFETTDQAGKPLSMALSADRMVNTTSDSDGWAQMLLGRGKHTLYARYGANEQSSVIDVQNDTSIPLSLRLYNLRVRVLDDSGNPLSAQLNVGPSIYSTDSAGYVRLFNLTSSPLPVLAYYGSFKKEASVNLELFNQTIIVFDSHPPQIDNPQGVYNGSMLRVQAAVTDPGDYGSGLSERQASISLQYTLPGETKPKTIPMYAIGYNLFEAAIPLTGGSGDVRYTIIASDADGNTAQSSDVFNLAIDKPAPEPSSSLTPSAPRSDLVAQYGWLVGLFLLVVIGGGYWYYVSRRAPSGRMGGSSEYHYQGADEPKKKSGFQVPIKFNRERPPKADV
ncbi:Carboxypeptidase regulatory-like domain protein [uncultured archaeon]|nr:Carboxypeptidase regulatory-like domain protein [uncultured archaeon]